MLSDDGSCPHITSGHQAEVLLNYVSTLLRFKNICECKHLQVLRLLVNQPRGEIRLLDHKNPPRQRLSPQLTCAANWHPAFFSSRVSNCDYVTQQRSFTRPCFHREVSCYLVM